jgi:hypothetical protein
MPHDVRVETYDGPRESLRALFELAEDSAAELDSYIGTGRYWWPCRTERSSATSS